MSKTAAKSVTPRKVVPNAGHFQKGTPGGPGRGKKKAVIVGSLVYDDLHAAYTTPPGDGESPGVKAARKLFAEKYETFLSLYLEGMKERRLESEATAKVEAEAGPKEEKVEELLDRLFTSFEASR